MKLKNILQKVGVLALAGVMAAGSMDAFSPPIDAAPATTAAATDHYIKFRSSTDPTKLDTIAHVITGDRFLVETKIPSGVSFGTPPFSVTQGTSDMTTSGRFTTTGSEPNFSVLTNASAASDLSGMTIYTFSGNFTTAGQQSAQGNAKRLPPTMDSTDPDKGDDYAFEARVTNPAAGIAISQNSTVNFTVTRGQAVATDGLTFTTVTATGDLASSYNGQPINFEGNSTVEGKRCLTVSIQPKPGSEYGVLLRLQLLLEGKDATFLVKEKTVFSFTFYRAAVNSMIVNVHTPDNALDADIAALQSGKESAKAEDDKTYMTLAAGDTLDAITQEFPVRTEVPRYNAKIKADWKFIPDSAAHSGHVELVGGIIKIYNPPPEDMPGKFEVTFTHTDAAGNKTQKSVSLDATILGTGVRPKVNGVSTIAGTYDPVTGRQKDQPEVPVTTVPSELDVYDGGLDPSEYKPANPDPWDRPYKFKGQVFFGKSRGRAEKMTITQSSANGGAVDLYYGAGQTSVYRWGSDIANNSLPSSEQIDDFTVQAKSKGSVELTFHFFNAAGDEFSPQKVAIQVLDSSPSPDAFLDLLDMIGTAEDSSREDFQAIYPSGMIDYAFAPETLTYTIELPYQVKAIRFKPHYRNSTSRRAVRIAWNENTAGESKLPPDFGSFSEIPLTVNQVQTVSVYCTAENLTPQVYTLNIKRREQSDNGQLSSLTVTLKDADGTPVEITPTFNPNGMKYKAKVKYAVDEVHVKAVAANQWADKVTIDWTPRDGGLIRSIMRAFEKKDEKDVTLVYDESDPNNLKNITTVTINVKPENGAPDVVYTLEIERQEPDRDNTLAELKVYRDREAVEVPLQGTGFDKTVRDYYVTVPYQTTSLRLDLLPNSVNARAIKVIPSPAVAGRETEKPYRQVGTALQFSFAGLAPGADANPELNELTYMIQVLPEDGRSYTDPPYVLHVTRAPPDTVSSLTSMTVTNAADNKPIPAFSFMATKTEYNFSVDYEVESVMVTPVAKSTLSKVYINGKLVTTNLPSREIKLSAGVVTAVQVLIVPESGTADQTIYTLNITRKAPGTEARLMNLVVNGGTDQKPTPFQPAVTSYSWSIPEGVRNFTVTATAVDAKATIMIDGKVAKSGSPSEPIVTTQASTTVQVVVTAEDGKTTKTYTLKIKDYNFIKKSTNADLSSLKTNYGNLAPAFNPTVTDYELYVKPTAMSLGVDPIPANANATIKVSADSKQLTEYNRWYTSSILADAMEFTIEVVAEDGKAKKTYTINVYRNDEEKQGIFQPITADMVNFELPDPIMVDISSFPVVEAEVFNRLKTDYPDKRIIFKGNDYTLEIKGTDLDTLVPNTTSYDLSFSFAAPEKQDILDVLEQSGNNAALDPVYLHFDHHGALPGPMLLTVSLGREYRNRQLFWNYYNPERARIDYYGYVNTNAKGTFSVPVDHFSTYLVTIRRIAGAENKSGLDYAAITLEDESLNEIVSAEKPNPGTGVSGGSQ